MDSECIYFRECRDEDLDSCSVIFVETFNQPPWNDQWQSSQQAKIFLSEYAMNISSLKYVCIYKDNIIGFTIGHVSSFFDGKEFFIDVFCISQEYQSNGYGSRMIDYLKEELKKKDIHEICLITKYKSPAQYFYQNHDIHHDTSMIFCNGSF
ncbi:hypothetical protein WA158_001454 [Blastocystis sp. Blastoise]